MLITDYVNSVSTGLSGLTVAGTALSTAIIGWIMFWRSTAKLIPTEFANPYLAVIFRALNLVCKILGLDIPDIAKFDWHNMRIVTKSEVVATKIVNAVVIPASVVENPPPPAAPLEEKPKRKYKKRAKK